MQEIPLSPQLALASPSVYMYESFIQNDDEFGEAALVENNPPANTGTQVRSLGQEDPWSRKWHSTPVLLS